MNDNKIKVTECIREFKLRQQYPSVVKKLKNTGKMVVLNTSLESLKPVTTNLTSKTNIPTKNELRKIKLKLPNGKYLGEFNVQILPNNNDNTLKNKRISIINQNKDKQFYKSTILPNAILESKKRKLITTKHLQSMKSEDQKNLSPNSLYLHETSNKIKNNDIDTKDDNTRSQSKVIASSPVINNAQYSKGSNYRDIENMDIDNENNNCEGSKYSKVQSKLIQNQNNSDNINNILSDVNPKKKFNVIDLKSSNYNLAQQTVNITHNECIPERENVIGKNVMVILHENGMSLLDNSIVSEHKTVAIPINDKDFNAPIVNLQNENSNVKSLKTLDNRDNEINHQISSDKSNDTKTVCDITMKTDDYSLQKLESSRNEQTSTFSIANRTPKNCYSLKTPENLNANSLDCMPFYDNFPLSPFNQLQDIDMFLNDNLINNICSTHSTANKVKTVLSQPNVLYTKIFEQLKKDFENVRNWDENGMLNIHKAVISNRMYDVQRHLLVFQACNVNVEIPTQSGMTSLELAIKHNASAKIVKLLLEAGANPTSFQRIHESALILASKASSSLLPELIQHVPSSRLLDHFDFSGFAAIHYCAQHGNLEGINSLINRGANINLQESRSGRTALFLALENNYTVVAQKLIENGAQTDIPNFSGQTVMSLLDKSKDFSLVTLVCAMK